VQVFTIFSKDQNLGTLRVEHFDQPWFYAEFQSTEAFEPIRHLFEPPESFRRVHGKLAVARWSLGLKKEIEALDLRITDRRGYTGKLWMIHIDGTRAWWRLGYSRSSEDER
jgi:hypothetical protein